MSATGISAALQTLAIQGEGGTGHDQYPLLQKTPSSNKLDKSRASIYASQHAKFHVINILTIAQWRNIDLLPFPWLAGLSSDPNLIGSTAKSQQVPIKHNLVYKRITGENDKTETIGQAFRLFAIEMTIQGLPIIRNHPSIARLEAICWDFEGEDISPALAYKKVDHGDLRRFMHTDIGRTITIEKRLRLCSDIASAVMTLHSVHVIYGDFKPENVLIVEENPGEYRAKLISFGYSILNSSRQEDVSVPLRVSWPWSAPEISEQNPYFPMTKARAADYFSFGMLCLWILFNNEFSYSSESDKGLQELDALKKEGTLNFFALYLVTKNINDSSGLPHEYTEGLSYFFRWTLAHDPLKRTGLPKKQYKIAKSAHAKDLEAIENGKTLPKRGLVSSMGITYEDVFGVQSPFGYFVYPEVSDMDLGTKDEHTSFDLTRSIGQIAVSDFRLWNHIRDSLEEHAVHQFENNGNSPAAFSLALLYRLGIVLPKDLDTETHIAKCIFKSGKTEEDLSVEIKRIRDTAKTDNDSDIDYDTISHASYYRQARIIETAQPAYEAIMHKMEHSLGPYHPIFRKLSMILIQIWIHQELHEKAESLLGRLVFDWQIVLGPRSRDVMQAEYFLASAYLSEKRYKDTISLAKTLVEKSKRTFGKEAAFTLAASAILASAYSHLGSWTEALQLQESNLTIHRKIFGPSHPRSIASACNLFVSYSILRRFKEAKSLERGMLDASINALGEDNVGTAAIMSDLSTGYHLQGRHKESEKLEKRILKIRRKWYGWYHPLTLISQACLTCTYLPQGLLREAVESEKPITEALEKKFGLMHPLTLDSRNSLSQSLWLFGKKEEAVEMMEQVIQGRRQVHGEKHVKTKKSETVLMKYKTEK
ncbi:hypothetical protein N0V90_012615 [Kalmusia sp. IMI 367209]|nr:hypothetical protein N0V90_012615 [Kalmusia sp. IMI 367209]